MRIFSIICLLAGVACGTSKQPASHANLCDAFEASATSAKLFRDEARAELARMDDDVQRWIKFEAGTFTPEDDAAGELSGAKQTVYGHGERIAVWCRAAVQVRRDLALLAYATQIDEVHAAGRPLDESKNWDQCYDSASRAGESRDPRKRQDAAAKMATWSTQATQDERDLIAACRAKLGRSN